MKFNDKSVTSGISAGLKQMKQQTGYQTTLIADLLEIPHRTFEGYLYGLSAPTLAMLIKLSNQFKYPLNTLFSSLIVSNSNEQRFVTRLCTVIENQPESVRSQINSIITPIIDSMSKGLPVLMDKELGGKIRILREDASLSKRAFVEYCDITLATLKQLESNQHFPSVAIFCKICKTLEVSPEYLLAKQLSYLSGDRKFYALTPRQLKALSEAVNRLSCCLK